MDVTPAVSACIRSYLCDESSLFDLANQLLSLFPTYYDPSLEEEIGLISEILACLYEVQDGVMPEPKFRLTVAEFLKSRPITLRKTAPNRRRQYQIMVRIHGRVQKVHIGKKTAHVPSCRIQRHSKIRLTKSSGNRAPLRGKSYFTISR